MLSLHRYDVPIWLNSRLVELLVEEGRVVGAVLDRSGKRVNVCARKGVLLASGGFERNAEMRAKYLPAIVDPLHSGAPNVNMGDGIVLGQRIGAATRNLNSAWFGPMFRVPGEDRGRLCTFERALPGCIIVNQSGRRYQNEAASYHISAVNMIESDAADARTIPSWIVFDGTFRHRFPMGPVLPLVPDWMLPKRVREILVFASSWEELASKINVPADTLKETIERFNQGARVGKDSEFGRGDAAYDRYYGDPRATPNPNLAPLEKAPFYAMPIYPGDIGTNGGLVTNGDAQVIDENQRPIEALYATGNCSASVMGRSYPGAGSTLGPAMAFGYAAACHMVDS